MWVAPAVKTMYIYSMSSRLFNVRLDEDLARKLAKLREDGLTFKELVRNAIEERYANRAARRKPRDVDAIMKRIFEQYPDPPELPALAYDVHDRHQAREAILRHLESKRQRDAEWYLNSRPAKSGDKRKGKPKGKRK